MAQVYAIYRGKTYRAHRSGETVQLFADSPFLDSVKDGTSWTQKVPFPECTDYYTEEFRFTKDGRTAGAAMTAGGYWSIFTEDMDTARYFNMEESIAHGWERTAHLPEMEEGLFHIVRTHADGTIEDSPKALWEFLAYADTAYRNICPAYHRHEPYRYVLHTVLCDTFGRAPEYVDELLQKDTDAAAFARAVDGIAALYHRHAAV